MERHEKAKEFMKLTSCRKLWICREVKEYPFPGQRAPPRCAAACTSANQHYNNITDEKLGLPNNINRTKNSGN